MEKLIKVLIVITTLGLLGVQVTGNMSYIIYGILFLVSIPLLFTGTSRVRTFLLPSLVLVWLGNLGCFNPVVTSVSPNIGLVALMFVIPYYATTGIVAITALIFATRHFSQRSNTTPTIAPTAPIVEQSSQSEKKLNQPQKIEDKRTSSKNIVWWIILLVIAPGVITFFLPPIKSFLIVGVVAIIFFVRQNTKGSKHSTQSKKPNVANILKRIATLFGVIVAVLVTYFITFWIWSEKHIYDTKNHTYEKSQSKKSPYIHLVGKEYYIYHDYELAHNRRVLRLKKHDNYENGEPILQLLMIDDETPPYRILHHYQTQRVPFVMDSNNFWMHTKGSDTIKIRECIHYIEGYRENASSIVWDELMFVYDYESSEYLLREFYRKYRTSFSDSFPYINEFKASFSKEDFITFGISSELKHNLADSLGFNFTPLIVDSKADIPSEGLYRIVDSRGKIGYADTSGRVIICPQYSDATPFKDDKASYRLDMTNDQPSGNWSEIISPLTMPYVNK